MRYALIGCGRISPNHIQAAINNKLDIVAICDIVPDRMDSLESKLGISGVVKYTDYKEMIVNEKPDIVAIATESGKHAEIALFCIESGCNVIIEKPIALSIKDADAIIETAERNGVKVCANHQNRFNKAIRKIRESLEGNRFGKLFYGTAHIRWNRNEEYYKGASWRGTWALDGGTLMNQCIHDIDLLRWMMGNDVDEVIAYSDRLNHENIETEDLGLALVKFKNGSYGVIEGTTDVFPNNLEETLYIFGEKGTVKAGGQSVNTIEEWRFADDCDDSDDVKKKFSDTPPNIYGFGHTPLYADMIEAVVNDREPYVNAVDGKNAVELVLAIYKSAKEGRPVKFPLKDCSTTDFIGRFDK